MTIDARFNINPFIGDVIINADDASTSIICTENANDPGQYIVQQDIKIYGTRIKEEESILCETILVSHITLRRYTKDMSNEDAQYFIDNYLENPSEE